MTKTITALLLFSSCYFISCQSTPTVSRVNNPLNKQFIDTAYLKLQAGDIVFRRGSDAISDIFSKFGQQDNTYSHCGIALNSGDSIHVFHSLGGEDNPDATIRNEVFYNFVTPATNNGFGIVRFPFTPVQLQLLDSITKLWYAQKVMFDNDFDLKTNQRMYCAEFVYKAVQTAVQDSSFFNISHIKSFTYVAPDNILMQQQAHRIYERMYQ